MMRFDVEFFGGAVVGATVGLILGLAIGQARGDCTGCAPGDYTTSGQITFAPTQSKVILTIQDDGAIKRGETRIEDLDRDELVVVVRELVDLIRKGK